MTRANTEQLKHTPWFAKAGAACSIVPISRFVGPNIFALKGGGYGCLFSLAGIDEEGLTDLELESRVRSIEGRIARTAGRLLPLPVHPRHVGVSIFPGRAKYANPVTQVFASDRLAFLEKTAALPPHRPALVPHAGAVEGQSLRAQAAGERRRHIADAGRA